VQRCVRDRSQMENGVELFVTELYPPIERGQILRDKIAAIAAQIFEIAGAKIVDYRESRVGKFFLERECQIGADKAGAAGDEKIGRGCGHKRVSGDK